MDLSQPLFSHWPGVPDSYNGGLSTYCADEAGGGTMTMLFLGPLGPLTGLTLVGAPGGDRDIGGGVGFEGA